MTCVKDNKCSEVVIILKYSSCVSACLKRRIPVWYAVCGVIQSTQRGVVFYADIKYAFMYECFFKTHNQSRFYSVFLSRNVPVPSTNCF